MLTVTISETLKRGFRAGPLIVLGQALLEMVLLALIWLGLGPFVFQLTPSPGYGETGWRGKQKPFYSFRRRDKSSVAAIVWNQRGRLNEKRTLLGLAGLLPISRTG